MTDLVEIQQLEYDNIAVVLPSLNDIKLFLIQNEDIFDLLLKQNATVTSILVVKVSKMYDTAVNNRNIVVENHIEICT